MVPVDNPFGGFRRISERIASVHEVNTRVNETVEDIVGDGRRETFEIHEVSRSFSEPIPQEVVGNGHKLAVIFAPIDAIEGSLLSSLKNEFS